MARAVITAGRGKRDGSELPGELSRGPLSERLFAALCRSIFSRAHSCIAGFSNDGSLQHLCVTCVNAYKPCIALAGYVAKSMRHRICT